MTNIEILKDVIKHIEQHGWKDADVHVVSEDGTHILMKGIRSGVCRACNPPHATIEIEIEGSLLPVITGDN